MKCWLLSFLYSISRLDWIVQFTRKEPLLYWAAEDDDVPVFGKIQQIVSVDVDKFYSVTVILHTMCFNSHFHAYEVEHASSPNYAVIKPTDLCDHILLDLYTCTVSDKWLN